MTTYQEQFQKAVAGKAIPAYWLGYFRELHREALNEQLIERMATIGISKADLARKIGRRPEQLTRWINSPSNLEADTISDLALAFGCRPKVVWEHVAFEPEKTTASDGLIVADSNVVAVDFSDPDRARTVYSRAARPQMSSSSPTAVAL